MGLDPASGVDIRLLLGLYIISMVLQSHTSLFPESSCDIGNWTLGPEVYRGGYRVSEGGGSG